MSLSDTGNEKFNSWRSEPMYTFGEAARLAGVSTTTVGNWLLGYSAGDRDIEPLFRSDSSQGPMVSFIQLIEIVVAGRFRKAQRVPLYRVRQAHENAQQQFHLEYPFAHLRLEALGGHIVGWIREEPSMGIALDEPQQWTLPGLVLETVQQIQYIEELASRWWPQGKETPIVVDPRISTGLPVIEDTGVTVQILHKRWKAGQGIDFLANDFKLKAPVVESALRYAENTKIAA